MIEGIIPFPEAVWMCTPDSDVWFGEDLNSNYV